MKWVALSAALALLCSSCSAQNVFCPTGKELFFDTFTNGNDGWNAPTRTYQGEIGAVLGPFAVGSPNPSKTYNVGADAGYVMVQFDFLEVDSWDQSAQYGYDGLQVAIGNESIDIGGFSGAEEGTRSGVSQNGIAWTLEPKTGITNIRGSNGSYRDEIHIISLVVPDAFFADGNLKLTMKPQLTQGASDESASFDNIRISSCGIPEMGYCTSEQELFLDTFTNGNEGWSNPRLASLPGLGQFLGRYAVGHGKPSKTFNVGSHDFVQVQFDFLELDSWDNTQQWGYDKFHVEINGERMTLGNLVTEGATGESQNGIKWIATAKGEKYHMASTNRWEDQIHLVTFYVPKDLMPSGTVTVTLDAELSSAANDESAGYDNIRVTAFDGCDSDIVREPIVIKGPLDASTCKDETEISRDTFDNGTDDWSNGRLYTLDQVGQFLGRYTGNVRPAKTFQIDSTTDFVKLEFDFVEIDSWDASQQYGYDKLYVILNTQTVNLGVPSRTKAGTDTKTGVQWVSKTIIEPTALGGNDKYDDEVMNIVMLIPKSIFSNGQLTVQFHAAVNQGINDESGGFDNVILTELTTCDETPSIKVDTRNPGNILTLAGNCALSGTACGYCEGNCYLDEDCPDGSTCFRTGRHAFAEVPGCSGSGLKGIGYCTGATA